MVTRKELLERIEKLENETIKKSNIFLMNAIKSLNKKLNSHIKGEKTEKEQTDKINEWLKHDGIDEVQELLNKGVK